MRNCVVVGRSHNSFLLSTYRVRGSCIYNRYLYIMRLQNASFILYTRHIVLHTLAEMRVQTVHCNIIVMRTSDFRNFRNCRFSRTLSIEKSK